MASAVVTTSTARRVAGVPPVPEELRTKQHARRQRIVRAALAAATRSNYDDVKMTTVARDAGVALGTVYRYFASKEHLFAAVFLEWQGALDRRLAKAAPRGDSEAERVLDVYSRVLTAFELQPQFLRILMIVEMSADANAIRTMNTAGAYFRDSMSGVFDEYDDARSHIAFTITSVLFSGLRAWSRNRMTIADVRVQVEAAIHLIYHYQSGSVQRGYA